MSYLLSEKGVMLTFDAYGVLPPIARLTPAQAMYYFLSGFTSKVAGTELGVTTPLPTFSTCFGAPLCRAVQRYMAIYNVRRSPKVLLDAGSSILVGQAAHLATVNACRSKKREHS
jgi:hypothetical protein